MQKIDIKEVFKQKSPTLYRKIPNFIFKIIGKILHIKDINNIIQNYGHLSGLPWTNAIAKDFNIKIDVSGVENIPKDGRFIFAANHPLGAFDGILLLREVLKVKEDSKFLVNDILMNIGPLKDNFVPINKHGGQKGSVNVISEAYSSDSQILIFPSGLASRKIDGKIIDLEWKKHIILKSKQHQRDIIPVYIGAKNSRLFYTVAHLRKLFKIKANLEMFLLPREFFNKRNSSISFTFGEPIPYTKFTPERRPNVWAQWLKDKTYSLK